MRTGKWLGWVAVTFTLVSCGGSGSSTPSGLQIRAVNAVTGLTGANILAGATIAMQGGSYGSFSGYMSASSGSIPVQLSSTTTTLAQTTTTFVPNGIYTIYADGTLANPGLLVLQETESPPSGANATFEVVDLSPTAGGVDVYITAPGGALTTPSFTNLQFQGPANVTLPAAQYQVTFTKTGAPGSVLASYTTGVLADGTIPRLLLIDANNAAGGPPQSVVAMFDLG